MSHPADPDELLEVLGDELRPIVGDDPRPRVGEALAGPLDDRLDVGLGQALAEFPVGDEPAAAVEEAAEVEEGPGDVDVGDIDVPVLVGAERLLEALALERWLAVMCLHQSGGAEDAIDARRADGDDVGVEHHEGESPVALEGMAGVELEDGLLLPGLEPPVAGHAGVVLVGRAVARRPVVELAGGDAQPADEPLHGDLGARGPVADEADDGVAGVVGDPGPGQRSPSSFFSLICSSINSATTSFLRWSLSRKAAMVRWRWPSDAESFRWKAAGPFSKNCFCQR